MFCFHKYGEVLADGFQYCKKCGLANKPLHKPIECQHSWVTIDVHNTVDRFSNITGQLFTLRCPKCGDMKSFKTRA